MSEMHKRISELCESCDLTISQMCRKTGISRSTISELKSGRSKTLTVKNLSTIASFFDVPCDFISGTGVFSNWNDVMKHLDFVFERLKNDIPPNYMWHEEDEKNLYAYLDTSFYYARNYSVFTNWLFESVDAIEIHPIKQDNCNFYSEFAEVNIVYKSSFSKLMKAAWRDENKSGIRAIGVKEMFEKFIKEHEFDTSDEEIEELISVFRRLNFSSKRQLLGKAYELLDSQNNPQGAAEAAPPDIDMDAHIMDRRIKK